MTNRLNPLAVIALITIPVLWGVRMVMPVFDDWWYLTTPGAGMSFTVESLLPKNQYWRPFDALFGILLAKWPWLFPALNHLCVVLAHVGCTMLVYRIMRMMALSRHAMWTGTLFYYMSPAVLGTLLNCDSLNQAYSAFFGLLSLHVFVTAGSRHRHRQMALQSGTEGQRLANEILKQSHRHARNVLLLYDDTPQPGYSTFCTPPIESFGYGEAVRMATGYDWPDNITGVPAADCNHTDSTVQKALRTGYDAVWQFCDGRVRVLAEKRQSPTGR